MCAEEKIKRKEEERNMCVCVCGMMRWRKILHVYKQQLSPNMIDVHCCGYDKHM